MQNKVCAIIVAAGSGRRMGAKENKVFLNVLDKPILAHTLIAFQSCNSVDMIVLVTRECDIQLCHKLVEEYNISKITNIIVGGDTRQKSVYNGLKILTDDIDIVTIHDGARALIDVKQINDTIINAQKYGAAALGVKCKDTLKQIDENGFIVNTIDREYVYNIQTPQTFKRDIITTAHKNAEVNNYETTDDCAVAEYNKIPIKIIEGSYDNIKLTTPEDLAVAENILKKREFLKCE